MVDQYYDLATDFYEFGWGESFHFGHRYAHESLKESLVRHEYYLASRLGLQPGLHCLDVGCGVGGPARNIARFSGAPGGRQGGCAGSRTPSPSNRRRRCCRRAGHRPDDQRLPGGPRHG
jgi:hypothetical protein